MTRSTSGSSGILWPLVILFVFVVGISLLGFFRGNPLKHEDGALNREAIEEIVADYIAKNPQAIIKSVENMHKSQMEEQGANAKESLKKNKDQLFSDPSSPVGGNPEGSVTVVEFFDYSCGFCKRVQPAVVKLLEENSDVRFIFKEFPILGPASEIGARAALAVHAIAPEKYLAFHSALLTGRITDKDSVLAIAKEQGLDADKIAQDMDSDRITGILQKNHELASGLGINGTPAFIIGEEIVPGAISYEQLADMVKNAKK